MKIKINQSIQNSLEEIHSMFESEINELTMSKVVGSGCGSQCKVTCAHYCHDDIVSGEISPIY